MLAPRNQRLVPGESTPVLSISSNDTGLDFSAASSLTDAGNFEMALPRLFVIDIILGDMMELE